MLWGAVAALGLSASSVASAAEDSAADAKVICKRDGTVGTRLAKRVCLTRAQWKESDTALRDQAKDSQRDYQRDNEVRLPNKGDGIVTQGPN
jgi:hypothetical protein